MLINCPEIYFSEINGITTRMGNKFLIAIGTLLCPWTKVKRQILSNREYSKLLVVQCGTNKKIFERLPTSTNTNGEMISIQ